MIKVLGMKRVLLLVILVAINVAMGAAVYAYLIPENFRKQSELDSIKSQITTKRDDIAKIQVDIKQLYAQQATYEGLRKQGFFGSQDRRAAEVVFQDIQDKAGVISAVASVLPASVEDNAEAMKAEHKVLKSPVKLEIESLTATGVYRYIYLLQQHFPGYISISDITIKRNAEINGGVLREIENGANPSLVSAEINMIWTTMIPNSEIINAPVAPVQ